MVLSIKIRKISPARIENYQEFTETTEIISCKSTVPTAKNPAADKVTGSNAIKVFDETFMVGDTEEIICDQITFSSMES